MNTVVIASDEADAHAAQAVEEHHAQLAGVLALKVETLAEVARAGRPLDLEAGADLVGWCRAVLVPHAFVEERTLYAAAAQRPEARLLVEAMLAEHRVILDLVEDLEAAVGCRHCRGVGRRSAGRLRGAPGQGERPGPAVARWGTGRVPRRPDGWHA